MPYYHTSFVKTICDLYDKNNEMNYRDKKIKARRRGQVPPSALVGERFVPPLFAAPPLAHGKRVVIATTPCCYMLGDTVLKHADGSTRHATRWPPDVLPTLFI